MLRALMTRQRKPEPIEDDGYFERMRVAPSPDADRIIPLIRWRERMTNR